MRYQSSFVRNSKESNLLLILPGRFQILRTLLKKANVLPFRIK
jgi:hypothetical protein